MSAGQLLDTLILLYCICLLPSPVLLLKWILSISTYLLLTWIMLPFFSHAYTLIPLMMFFSDSSILQSFMSFQSSLSADLVQVDLFPDSPMLSNDELLALTASDIHPAHQALHALDLHLHQTQSS